ncbi:MAG: hypothetical protein ABR910_10800 [Acidobacteriaceae bacterium]|jgi:hypothetical protein
MPGEPASPARDPKSERRPNPRPHPLLRISILAIAIAIPASTPAQQPPPSALLASPPSAWAVDCANNQVLVMQHTGSYLRYRFHEITEKGDLMRDQIETSEGSVARLIQRDGRPLTPEEDAAERDRLNDLLTSPSAWYRHVHKDQDNRKLGVQLLKLMPAAMLWSYAPGQPQPPNQPPDQSSSQPATGAPLIVIDFKPNPAWSPPDIGSQFLTGLEGRLWIDPRTRRMVHLEADIFRPVNFGWGVVAHLYPGGTVTLHQTAVLDAAPTPAPPNPQPTPAVPRFIVDHIDEHLTVRALMVRTVKQRLLYDSANFQPVPAMSYQQAIKLLLDTPLPQH